MQMVIFIKASGKTAKPMVTVFSAIPKAPSMMDSGKTISNMEKELNFGTTIKSNMMETFLKAKRQEREDLSLKEAHTMETLLTDSSMELESITSQTQERYIRENSRIIQCRVMES